MTVLHPLVRRELQQRAAQAVGQGWKRVGIDPTQLIELLRTYRVPDPDAKDLEIARLQGALQDAQALHAQAQREVQQAGDAGYARAMRDVQPELMRLKRLDSGSLPTAGGSAC